MADVGSEVIRLHEEARLAQWLRMAAETMTTNMHFFCNESKLKKRPSHEVQTFLMLELIAREPRPFVEYLTSGLTRLRRAELIGDGTKKSPYRGQWREDFYKL